MSNDTPAKQGVFNKVVDICRRAADVDVSNDLVLSQQRTTVHEIKVSAIWILESEWESNKTATSGGQNYYYSLADCKQAAEDYINARKDGELDRLNQIAIKKASEYNGGLHIATPDDLILEKKHFSHTNACSSCNGHGALECNGCAGRGAITCSGCGGIGRYTCTGCNGSGGQYSYNQHTKVRNYIHCYACGGGGIETCKGCGGGGENTCWTCRGRGDLTCGSCGGGGFFTTTYVATISAKKTVNIYVPSEKDSLKKWHDDFFENRQVWLRNLSSNKTPVLYFDNGIEFRATLSLPFNEIDGKLKSWSGTFYTVGKNSDLVVSYDLLGDMFLDLPIQEYRGDEVKSSFIAMAKNPAVRSALESRNSSGSWLADDSFISQGLVDSVNSIYKKWLTHFKTAPVDIPLLNWLGLGIIYTMFIWILVSLGVASHASDQMDWLYLGFAGPVIGKMQYFHWWLTEILPGPFHDIWVISTLLPRIWGGHSLDDYKVLYPLFSLLTGILIYLVIFFWVSCILGRSVSKSHKLIWKICVSLVFFMVLYAVFPVMPDWSYLDAHAGFFYNWVVRFKDGAILLPDFMVVGMILGLLHARHGFIQNYLKKVSSYGVPEINDDLGV